MTGELPSVVITGFGVVSPLGRSPDALARRFCAGESALRMLSDLGVDGARGATVDAIPLEAILTDKRAHIGRLDRLCRLFLSAAHLAVDTAQLVIEQADAERVGISFGTGLGCLLSNAEYYQKVVEQGPAAASPRVFTYTVSSAAAGELSINLGIKGANVTSHAGFAAGLQAIGYGFDLIRMGKADVVLAGGADALGPALLAGLNDMGLLSGICPSEGAAVAVLEHREHARQRNATCWARIDGYAAGFEPTLIHPHREPTALIDTMRHALAAGGRAGADVGFVVTSATRGELDAVERAALTVAFEGAAAPLLIAPKLAWGESFGAHGAQATALAAALLRTVPPLSDGVAEDLNGTALAANDAQRRLEHTRVAMVHSLCYSGPTVALVLAREESP
jgi:3-oxoacyl-[acyl-carrier-protein] synthase II